ncbi:MAG: FGGY family carbohydrate kinase, partial [Planctomycetota bacterium]
MKNQVYVGIDLGSGSIKAKAYDDAGVCVASVKRDLTIDSDSGGKAEQSPDDWSAQAGACLQELSAILKEKSLACAGIAATGQMDGPVLLDSEGKSVGSVQMWCDSRCTEQCEKIDKLISQSEMLASTGHTVVTGYTAPKLLWLKENENSKFAAAESLILPKDYLTFLLTGQVCTDYSDASNTILLDINKGEWNRDFIDKLELSKLKFPKLLKSYDIAGKITAAGAAWSDLPEGIPVAAGAGDSIAAALGSSMIDSTLAQIVIGTSGNVNCVLNKA